MKSKIACNINHGRFISLVGDMFSKGTTFLGELMQNARRSGATRISFVFNGDNSLVVTDNGSGIADFEKLISIAESDWNETIMDEEKPYGIGFLSVAFAAQQISVFSNGKSLRFTSDDLVKQKEIIVVSGRELPPEGTIIALEGCKFQSNEIEKALTRLSKGFPIEVFFNGKWMERPHAQENLCYSMASQIGTWGMQKSDNEHFMFAIGANFYYQGLPIDVPGKPFTDSVIDNTLWNVAIHLDQYQFSPRMPDREIILSKSACQITSVYRPLRKEFIKKAIESRKREYSDRLEDFALSVWTLCKSERLLQSLDDVPFVPTSAFFLRTNHPGINTSQDTETESLVSEKKVFSRTEIENGLFFNEDAQMRQECEMILKTLAWQERIPCVRGIRGHWLFNAIVPMALESVDFKTLRSENFSTNVYSEIKQMKLVENVTITLVGGKVYPMKHPLVVEEGETIIIQNGYKKPASVLYAAADFTDEHEEIDYQQYDECVDNFYIIYDILNLQVCPEAAMQKIIDKNQIQVHKSIIAGQKFSVEFIENDGQVRFVVEKI